MHNRRFLEDALARESGRAMRTGETMALLIIDIDHFKKINDTYGHESGDAVLRELGAVLEKTIRKTDIVGRFGGEEFLVLMPGADIDAAMSRANAVLDAVRAMHVDIPNGAPLRHINGVDRPCRDAAARAEGRHAGRRRRHGAVPGQGAGP